MQLFRIEISPKSAWRTPWQADTIFGLLCWACARKYGDSILRQEIIEPSLTGKPPFVVSDAFPSGWLPAPAFLRSSDYLDQYRLTHGSDTSVGIKRVRKARWVRESGFGKIQRGELPSIDDFAIQEPFRSFHEVNNQISRDSNSTSSGGQLFVSDSWTLRERSEKGMVIFARTTEAFRSTLHELFAELSERGFGADSSTGKGEFELTTGLTPFPSLDEIEKPDASVVLSTFQPGSMDPTDGSWESFVKYGKLGPDFGFDNVFKRPIILLRPGAYFRTRTEWLGRAIDMPEFLEPLIVTELNSRGVRVIHPAFGLAVPAKLPGLLGVVKN